MKCYMMMFSGVWVFLASTAFAYVDENPGLPRVLLVGDSIRMGYDSYVETQLDGIANVHAVAVNCAWTTYGLSHMSEWLAGEHWDVVHFNFGLHDLKFNPPQVPLGEQAGHYEYNLRAIINIFETHAPGVDEIIWASTTPVPANSPDRQEGLDQDYNAAALGVMQDYGIMVNDLNSLASVLRTDPTMIFNPIDVHYTQAGYAALAEQVSDSIKIALAPEPITLGLMTLGLGGLICLRKNT
jgi:lysophospholipase L1-like esterase